MNILKYLFVTALFAFANRVSADESADRKACLSQLRELASLSLTFASSHDGRLPKSFDELLSARKTSDPSLVVSPLAADKSKPSYELLLPDKRLSGIADPARTISIRSLYTLKDGRRLAAFVDGHVEILEQSHDTGNAKHALQRTAP
jgi:prepilin-type processing-associated H-X9-DG protein